MKIIQKVVVKQVITEDNKDKLYKKFHLEKVKLEQECQHLLFEQRRLEKQTNTDLSIRFESEVKNRQEKIALVDFKIEQLDILAVGSEIVEDEVDALVDIQVGSKWDGPQQRAIIIEDDIVVRIDR